jgi:hypothetical protein
MKSESNVILQHSQSNFHELAEGNIRVPGVSITPAEKGYLNGRKIGKLILGKETKVDINAVINGFTADNLRLLMDIQDYFNPNKKPPRILEGSIITLKVSIY